MDQDLQSIDQPTAEIQLARKRWARNRDFVSGEDAVKKATTAYLKRLEGQSDDEYAKYLYRSPFFPGSARVHDGLMGLVFRKNPTLTAPANIEDVLSTITLDGQSVEDLAWNTVSETFVTGFTGLLVDYVQDVPAGMNVAQATKQGIRPFVSVYNAESILEVTAAVILNRQIITRVRLLDHADQVRELCFTGEGEAFAYTVHLYTRDDDNGKKGPWQLSRTVSPTKNAKPITTIPFVLVRPTTSKSMAPTKATLDDVVLINEKLYHAECDARTLRYFTAAPIPIVKGAKAMDRIPIAPGIVLQFPDHSPERPVETDMWQANSSGQVSLDDAVERFKSDMSQVGSRILATEKLAAEAAETLQIRRASENATLEAVVKQVGRRIEEALNVVAEWVGAGAVSFELNNDFMPLPMTAADRAALLNEWMSGAISHQVWVGEMHKGEAFSETITSEIIQQQIAEEQIDMMRPVADSTGGDIE